LEVVQSFYILYSLQNIRTNATNPENPRSSRIKNPKAVAIVSPQVIVAEGAFATQFISPWAFGNVCHYGKKNGTRMA
jgi:hypothetical protein